MIRTCYEVFDRLLYMYQAETLSLEGYMSKWEVSRSVFFRDKKYFEEFYGIRFFYDRNSKKYVREHRK